MDGSSTGNFFSSFKFPLFAVNTNGIRSGGAANIMMLILVVVQKDMLGGHKLEALECVPIYKAR